MRRSPRTSPKGYGRGSGLDFARFIQNAVGSSSELEYQLLLARDLDYLPDAVYERLTSRIVEVRRMLISLHQTLHTGGRPKRPTQT